jgi:hypothetical protein
MHNDNDMEKWKHANPGKGKLRIAMILWAIVRSPRFLDDASFESRLLANRTYGGNS